MSFLTLNFESIKKIPVNRLKVNNFENKQPLHQRLACCPKLFQPSQEGLVEDLYLSLHGASSNILAPEIHLFSPANQVRFYFIV